MAGPQNNACWDALDDVQNASKDDKVLGDLFTAAEAAKVMPNTLRVWMSRGKLKPLFGERGQEVFHIPTVVAIAEAGRARREKKAHAA